MRVGREDVLLEAVHFILDISCRSSAFAGVPGAREQLYLSIGIQKQNTTTSYLKMFSPTSRIGVRPMGRRKSACAAATPGLLHLQTLGLQVPVVGLLVKDADKEKYHKRRQASHA
jgi:hypothetical protein